MAFLGTEYVTKRLVVLSMQSRSQSRDQESQLKSGTKKLSLLSTRR